jgi:uncharacterized protein YbjT (DUF2867 family)
MTVLITGATGSIGRPLVEKLALRGVRVRAAARTIQSCDFPASVRYVNVDLLEPRALIPALDGVGTLFLHPRAVAANPVELASVAAAHGVRRLVALSALDVDEEAGLQPSRFNGDRYREIEEAVTNSGLSWTCIRASSYATLIMELFAAQIRVGDVVRGPYPTFAEAPVHEQDLVDVIARVLVDSDLDGRRIELTGPQSLSHREMVDIVGMVLGRPLRFVEIPPRIAADELVATCGVQSEFATALMARCERGGNQPATVADDVQKVLGCPARTFARWVADHGAAFRLRA